MPCYITGSEAGDRELEYKELKKEATKVTRLLCEACELLEHYSNRNHWGNEPLQKWYVKHLKIDDKRKKEEDKIKKQQKLKKQALSKLSKEEIDALAYGL